MPIQNAIIIGGGIAGLASALSLTKHANIHCSIYEIRAHPSTIGGAINLTPNALRYLSHLGVLSRLQPKGCEVKRIQIFAQRTGGLLGVINFDNEERFEYPALRVLRKELLDAMIDALKDSGGRVRYGMQIEDVREDGEGVIATFADGTVEKADLLLGCDGIHSTIRSKFIEPDRKPEYTGIANCYGFLVVDTLDEEGNRKMEVPFESTALFSGQLGSVLLSFVDRERKRMYTAAVMSVEDVGGRDGWRVKGSDQGQLKRDLVRRFANPKVPCLEKAIERVDDVVLYPVYRLPGNGVWTKGRMLLLGDAAHAMPPQGESVGLALEDVILLSQILIHASDSRSIPSLLQHYDRIRRPRIDAAVKAANFGFETIKDRGWFSMVLMEWFTWAYLWFNASSKEEEYAYDVRHVDLGL